MKIRIASDIHSEFFGIDEIEGWSDVILPPLPDDKETILVLAGDIGSWKYKEHLVLFINAVAPRFKEVLEIPGNHEYYGGDLQTTAKEIKGLLAHHSNLFFCKSGVALRDGRQIHLHTLWTDFDKENPQSMIEAQMGMNDYRLIRNGARVMRPRDVLEIHKDTVGSLDQFIREGDIVVTHHSPSLQSIPEEYLTDRVNGAYHSDLNDLILRKKPSIWVHGHTHTAIRYKIGETEIICNPRGYGNQYRKNGYDPTLTVEI